jgi:protein involved in polysaccharide export with SLBB domain
MKKLSLLLMLLLGGIMAFSQIPDDLSKFKSSQITDAQLKQYIDQAAKSGVSEQQVEAEFKKRGLPEPEMAILRGRIKLLQSGTGSGAAATNTVNTENATERVAPAKENVSAPVLKSAGLQVFGSELFNKSNISFEPNLKIPTPKNYILATDDQLIIDVFGVNEKQQVVKINAEGVIRLDYVGQIFLNGLTIEEATSRIKSKLSKVYPGISSGKTKLTVSLGNIRSIKVTIIGEAAKPGTYTLSSLATVFNALYESGGPSPSGSFREIELVRNNKTIQKIDIYNFLLKGDQSHNLRLEDMDVIRIPIVKTKVSISGAVKRQGIFEMLDGDQFDKLLSFAGGFKDDAYKALIKAERFTDKEKKILDIHSDSFINFSLVSGDVFEVSSILDRYENKVTITGSVFRPGAYALTENMTVKDLILKSEGFKEDVFLQKALITRYREDRVKEIISIGLSDLQNPKNNIKLQKDDELSIASIFDFKDTYTVSVTGAVRKPGNFPYLENITLKDVIQLAGGLKDDLYTDLAVLTRRKKDRSSEVMTFSLDSVINHSININLQPEDQVYISSKSEMDNTYTISVFGEVFKPGNIEYSKNLTLKSALFKAGGLTDLASIKNIEIARKRNDISPNDPNARLSDLIFVKLDTTDLNFIKDDVLLQPQDVITVKSDPFKQAPRTVSIYGDVLFPGTYTLETRKLRLTDLIERAGGLTIEANIEGTRLGRYKSENLRTDKVAVQKISYQVKDSTGQLKATYEKQTDEVVIDLQEAIKNPSGRANIYLEPGDYMFVPKFDPMVGVNGEILRPIKTPYVSGKSLRYYVNAAAGFVSSAEKNKVFVVYQNGKAAKTKMILGLFRKYPKIKPGANIFVPKEYEKPKKGFDAQKGLIISSALAALATMAVAIVNATK